MMRIVDNFLPHEEYQLIHDSICYCDSFPWYFSPGVSEALDGNVKSKDGNYFYHLIYIEHRPNGRYYDLIQPIIKKINPHAISRIKANFYPTTEKIIHHGWHQDAPFSHGGFIYYLNTNNGKTIFSTGEEVDSIANRALFFDPSVHHKSTTCSDDNAGRYNININYY